jgi:transcription elongation factor Elf1
MWQHHGALGENDSSAITATFSKKGEAGLMDNRKRYEGICPKCGKTMYICKSIAMIEGINTGTGNCPQCGLFLHMKFNQEEQRMDLEPFEDYAKRQQARTEVAKTTP